MGGNKQSDDAINLLDYWRVLMNRKGFLILIVGVVSVSSAIISLNLPKIYASTTLILPPNVEGLGLQSRLPGGLGRVSGGFMGLSSSAKLWMAILKSQTVLDAIVVQFNLKNTYRTKSEQDAARLLDGSGACPANP